MRQTFDRFSIPVFAAALMLCAVFAHSQVPVGMAPPLHFQFLDANGNPLANGKIFTYSAGTTTPLNTYADGTGTTQNTDPILLDATGSPSNGTVQTSIFLANNSYKFVGYNAANVQQWSLDNVSTYFGLLNSNNNFSGTNTFQNPVAILATDNQLVFGAPGTTTILDAPPPLVNIALHLPTTGDTLVGRDTPDTLTNKSLSNPFINGVQVIDGPATYISLPNALSSGTSQYTLTKMTGAGQVVTASIGDTGGVIGVCLTGCGTTGNATIIQSGLTNCFYDAGLPTPGHYVSISATTLGNCHDAGANYPSSGQVIGRASAGGGLILFGPEIRPGVSIVNVFNQTSSGNFLFGGATLSGGGTATVPIPAAFNTGAFKCTANDTTNGTAAAVNVIMNIGGSIVFNGTASHDISFICIGTP